MSFIKIYTKESYMNFITQVYRCVVSIVYLLRK